MRVADQWVFVLSRAIALCALQFFNLTQRFAHAHIALQPVVKLQIADEHKRSAALRLLHCTGPSPCILSIHCSDEKAWFVHGKRFAVLKAPATGETSPVNKVSFIFNFFDELRRKVPQARIKFPALEALA